MTRGRRALFVDDAARRVDDVRVALVHREEHVGVTGLVAAIGLGCVVEAQHRRGGAALHDPAHGVEPVGERRERERGADLGRRYRVQTQTGAYDDAERSLGADEELREVGPHCGTVRIFGGDERSVGQHDIEARHDVLDLAVAGGELARAAAREPTADRRERDRLRPVPARDAVVRA